MLPAQSVMDLLYLLYRSRLRVVSTYVDVIEDILSIACRMTLKFPVCWTLFLFQLVTCSHTNHSGSSRVILAYGICIALTELS